MLQHPCLALLAAISLSWLQLAAAHMALETQEDYLNHLYLQVKDRPLRYGELNLLPDDSNPGFANTVRCVTESEDGHADMSDQSRKMEFQRPTIKSNEDLVEVKVVINLPAGFTEQGEATLYEVLSDDTDERKLLDEASIPSCRSTCWFELTVGVDNMNDNMEFLVEFSHSDAEFIRELNPMMVLYTYREQPVSNLVMERRRSVMSKRQEAGTQEESNTLLSDLSERDDPCGKQTVLLDYNQLRWLDEDDIILISPANIQFDFCYGHCRIPLNLPPPQELTDQIGRRARLMEALNVLKGSRLTPPPCCIPTSYTASEIIYASGELVAMTTIPSVQGCGCRA